MDLNRWRIIFLFTTILLIFPWSDLPAVTVTPIGHISALGGQYFTGDTTSSGINLDSSIVPVITFTPKLYLIPIYLGSYNRTQSVYNFLGQNTLVNAQMDQSGILRMSWVAYPHWVLKPRIGYQKEWVQESTDETLKNGLFNNTRLFGGASVERLLDKGSLEIGYEYSLTHYYNYQSVISDPRLTSTGLTINAGTHVLDYDAHTTLVKYDFHSADKRWQFLNDFTWVRLDYVDQKIVLDQDNFEDKNRTDDVFNLALKQMNQPNSRWLWNFGETIQYYLSNQNAFDATTEVFYTYRYYNFLDTQLTPSITYRFGPAALWNVSLGGTYGFRQYSHRRSQDEEGLYQNSLVHSMDRGATLTFRRKIPQIKGLSAVLTGNVLTYWSNTHYETNYPYNYTVASYLGGLNWEF